MRRRITTFRCRRGPTTHLGGQAVLPCWHHNSTANALQVGTSAQHYGVASPTSKLYIDKIDQTSISQQDFKDAIGDANNREIYHSIVLTDAWFNGGFYWNNGYAHTTAYGNLRALVFYDRTLTSAEVTGLHAHFAGDYSSSEMIQ